MENGGKKPRRRITPQAVATAPAKDFSAAAKGGANGTRDPQKRHAVKKVDARSATIPTPGAPKARTLHSIVGCVRAGRVLAAAVTHGHLGPQAPALLTALAVLCRAAGRAALAPDVAAGVAFRSHVDAVAVAVAAVAGAAPLMELILPNALSSARTAAHWVAKVVHGEALDGSETSEPDRKSRAATANEAEAGALLQLVHSTCEAAKGRDADRQAALQAHEAALAKLERQRASASVAGTGLTAVMPDMPRLEPASAAAAANAAAAEEDLALRAREDNLRAALQELYQLHAAVGGGAEFSKVVRNSYFYVAPSQRRVRPSDFAPLARLLVASLADPAYGEQHEASGGGSLAGGGFANATADGNARGRQASGLGGFGRTPNLGGFGAATTPPPPMWKGRTAPASMERVMTNVWPSSLAQASARQRRFCRELLSSVRDVGLWMAVIVALREAIDTASAQLGDGASGDQHRGNDNRFVHLFAYGDVLGFMLNAMLAKVGNIGHATQAHLFRFHRDLVDVRTYLLQACAHRRLLACLPWLCPFYVALDYVRWVSPYSELRDDLEQVRGNLRVRIGVHGDRVGAMLAGLLDTALERGSPGALRSPSGFASPRPGQNTPLEVDFLTPAAPCVLLEVGMPAGSVSHSDGTMLDHLEGLVTDRILQTFNPSLARFRAELHRSEIRKINPTLESEATRLSTIVSAKDALKGIGANLKTFLEQLDAVGWLYRGMNHRNIFLYWGREEPKREAH